MMKKLIIILNSLACLFLAGCIVSEPPECLPGTERCESNPLFRSGIFYICQEPGNWLAIQSCRQCQGNACSGQSLDIECDEEGSRSCVDLETSSVQFECIQHYLVPEICDEGHKCAGDRCSETSQSCTDGTSFCYWLPELKLAVMSICSDNQFQAMYCEKGIGCDGGVCDMQPVDCPNTGEILSEYTNTCICDTSRHWTGAPGNCVCESGYLNVDNNCEQAVDCDKPGEYRDDATNTCQCDATMHWVRESDRCVCESEYVNLNGVCELGIICSNSGEIRDDATNTCVCNTEGHWLGTAGNCQCEEGYHPTRTSCIKCEEGEIWNARAMSCEYDCHSLIKDVHVGDIIKFGRYKQKAKSEEKQPIEWQVLAVESQKILVISKFVLDKKKYHETDADVTWEKCTLRSWLNGLSAGSNLAGIDYTDDSFIKQAFTDKELKCIPTVTNQNPDFNGENTVLGGNSTQDRIFCLRRDEAGVDYQAGYFNNDDERKAYSTSYVSSTNININKEDCYKGNCSTHQYAVRWWLRSPAWYQNYASYVTNAGHVYYLGIVVNDDESGVRPVMWLN